MIGETFVGENYGDDKLLFDAIAPYVENDSYIQMHGEDGDLWRWIFKDEKFKQVSAKITFEED